MIIEQSQGQQRPASRAVMFINWSDEDFSWKFGGVLYTCSQGERVMLQDYLAEHFAKHLVNREMDKLDIPIDHPRRSELLKRCFNPEETIVSQGGTVGLESKLLNQELKETASSKAEDHPVGPRIDEVRAENDEFSGLKKENQTILPVQAEKKVPGRPPKAIPKIR